MPNEKYQDEFETVVLGNGSSPKSSSRQNIPEESLSVGDILCDTYILRARLGRGGMGEVWKADEVYEGEILRTVVIKTLAPNVPNIQEEMARIQSMFHKIHSLQHQHICPMYAMKNDPKAGTIIVMKYINGIMLQEYYAQYIRANHEFPVSEVVRLLLPIAQALDYSHSKSVLHRDVKPQNILVSKDKSDGVQLIDFGLVMEMRSSFTSHGMGQQFDTSGTLPYMSPEQFSGEFQDARSDQFSLAVVVYELLAGHLPFNGTNMQLLGFQILNKSPDPIVGVPDHVNYALQRALAKNRKLRFESCESFIRALEDPKLTQEVLSNAEIKAVEEQKNNIERNAMMMRRFMMLTLGLALILIIGIIFLWAREQKQIAQLLPQANSQQQPSAPMQPIDETPQASPRINLTDVYPYERPAAEQAPGYATPGYVAPGYATPGTVAPGTVPPGTMTPGYVAPGSAIPGSAIPGTVTPGTVTPGTVPPGYVTPENMIPGNTQPGERAQETVTPPAVPNPEVRTVREPVTNLESEAAPVQQQTTPAVQSQATPAVQPQPAPVVQPQPTPEPQPQPTPVVQQPTPVVQPQPTPEPQPQPTPVVQQPTPAPQPAVIPAETPSTPDTSASLEEDEPFESLTTEETLSQAIQSVKNQDLEEAFQNLQYLTEDDLKQLDKNAQDEYGEAFSNLGMIVTAMKFRKFQMSRSDKSLETVLNCIRDAMDSKEFKTAIEWCDLVLNEDPLNIDIMRLKLIALANIATEEGESRFANKALEIANQLVEMQPEEADSYANRGFVYLKNGAVFEKAYDFAKKDFAKALSINPDSISALLYQGIQEREVYSNKLGAEKNFQKVFAQISTQLTRINKEISSINEKFEEINNSVIDRKSEKVELESKKAELESKKSDLESEKLEALYQMALLMEENEKPLNALDYLAKFLDLRPEREDVYEKRGNIYFENLHENENALKNYNLCLDIAPRNFMVRLQRAKVKIQMKQWQDAMDDLNFLIATDSEPKNQVMYYNTRADVYEGAGHARKAQEDRSQAKRINAKIAY